jgi:hypothetical protein
MSKTLGIRFNKRVSPLINFLSMLVAKLVWGLKASIIEDYSSREMSEKKMLELPPWFEFKENQFMPTQENNVRPSITFLESYS